jgi:hypothetical protein
VNVVAELTNALGKLQRKVAELEKVVNNLSGTLNIVVEPAKGK